MKLAEFIREAGGNPSDYPNCANLDVPVYDRKGRLEKEDTIHFVEPIFQHNQFSRKSFFNFMGELEKKLEKGEVSQLELMDMSIRMEDTIVIIRLFRSNNVFSRIASEN